MPRQAGRGGGACRGGRRCAPTPLRCSARGRAAGLAAFAPRTPLRHAAACQTRSALARADLGPPLLAATERTAAVPHLPRHRAGFGMVFPPRSAGRAWGGVRTPPARREGGWVWLGCSSDERPAAPKLVRLASRSECTCDPRRGSRTRVTPSRTPGSRRPGSCAASDSWSCTAGAPCARGRCSASSRRRRGRLRGSRRGSASSCPDRC